MIFIQNISFKNEHLLGVLCYFRVAENMNSKGIKILLMLVFIASAIHAQTGEIFGKITSEEGDTLPTTFVSLFKDGVQINATYSDFNGDYFFTGLNAGKYDVTCESLNFKKKTVKGVIVVTNQKVEVDFKLSGNNENQLLGTVDIVIYRKPLIDKDKQAQVYTADDIENLAARDISEIAATSVDVITQDDGSGDINIRGQRKEGTQFIVDGIKINGKLSIPQNAIEQIEVISGGLPAMYGDNIGGVIVVTTKGATAKPYGAIEGVTSKGIDGFDYNLLTASYSGSLMKSKKDSNGIVLKKSPIGYLLTGVYKDIKDPRPSALGIWSLKDDVLRDLEQNPLRTGASGLGTYRNSEFITNDDLMYQRANQNVGFTELSLSGKIDVMLSKTSTVTLGSNYRHTKRHQYIYDYSLFNSVNNPEVTADNLNAFFRWKQKINVDSIKWISDAFYQIQVDYSNYRETVWDDSHKHDVFKYGHVGRFKTHRESLYEYQVDGENGDAYYFQGQKDVLYEFLGGGSNENGANYAAQYYSLYDGLIEGNYEDNIQASNGGALLNGDRPDHVYDLWFNTGRQYNSYAKESRVQKRILGSFNAKLFKQHNLTFGFEYEERIGRVYRLNPINLWTRMRQLANANNTELDLDNPELTMSNGVFTDTVNYNFLYTAGEGKGFFENVRDKYGIEYSDYFDSDFYLPESYSLDMFSADELLQEGNGILYMVGYDQLGNPINDANLNGFFQDKNEGGSYTRKVSPFKPIYASGYIQDKYQFDDIVFNIGLRIDRYDANQPVLSDPYCLYDSYRVKDLSGEYHVPSSIDNDAVVYVNSLESENPSIVGYRLNSTWFDAQGEEITDPSIIAEASSSGEVTPYIKNTTKIGDAGYDPSSSFKDYEVQYSFMPRISFTFNLSESSSFYAHYDVLTQRPAEGQIAFVPMDYLFMENNVGAFIRNSNLKPQKTIDYEVGYQQALNTKSALTVSAYYREMIDLIQLTGINYAYPVNYITYGNSDKALVKGVSLKYDLRPISSNVSLSAGYTLQFADGTGSSPISSQSLVSQGQPDLKVMLPMAFDQRHTIKAIFNYGFKPGKKYIGPEWNGRGRSILGGVSANIVSKISSGRPYTGQSNFTPEGNITGRERRALDGLINGNRLPWIYTSDIRLTKKFVFGIKKEATYKFKTELYCLVKNLFNTKNIVVVYSATGNAEDDGYLDAATSQPQIESQLNYESYTDLYSLKIANPENYALPRQIRIGFVMTF